MWVQFSKVAELKIREMCDLNLWRSIRVIHMSFNIKNSMMQFLSSVYFAFTHHILHVIPYMEPSSEVWWSCWQILQLMVPNPLATELLYQVLHHTPAEMWGNPMMQEAQTYVSCLFKSSLISIHRSVTIEKWTHVHMIFLTGNYIRNKILKNVTGHPLYYFALFALWKEEQRTSDPEILQWLPQRTFLQDWRDVFSEAHCYSKDVLHATSSRSLLQ
jgi:hypothetical protein